MRMPGPRGRRALTYGASIRFEMLRSRAHERSARSASTTQARVSTKFRPSADGVELDDVVGRQRQSRCGDVLAKMRDR